MQVYVSFLIGFMLGALAQDWIKHDRHTDWDESPGGYTVIDEWHEGHGNEHGRR